MDYVIGVSNGELFEYAERQCLSPPVREFQQGAADEKPHVVLLRFQDRESVTPDAYCMVAARASQAGVEPIALAARCGVWGITDRDFVAWIEGQGGELYRDDCPGVYFIARYEIVGSTWRCKVDEHEGSGCYSFEAVAAALYNLSKPNPGLWITARDDRLGPSCR